MVMLEGFNGSPIVLDLKWSPCKGSGSSNSIVAAGKTLSREVFPHWRLR